MADKAVDPQYPSCPQHIQAPSEPREMHRAGPPGDDTLRMKGRASRPSLRVRRLSAPEAVSERAKSLSSDEEEEKEGYGKEGAKHPLIRLEEERE